MKFAYFLFGFVDFQLYEIKSIVKKVTHFKIMENKAYLLSHPYYLKNRFKKVVISSETIFYTISMKF